ncbi:MAG: hypothetical protein A2286_13785 [Gammaproteobacteria bacterium RIFOXYA12_FULL_61_12]|nr:MAG: hypothetical protein A2514_00110 [Gammaproteobacteria bacterium RIFOXYD12_FULL_61_37]OGT90857.1 MAG: hypothetical protein A2286_13785 [Gammaproteobacteria bacterium RIFOXYA12_FULL_61_12]
MNKILALLLALATLGAEAAMYKWTDENGKTVYSQQPPPTGEVERVRTVPTPEQSVEAARKKLQEQMQQIEDRREDREIAKDKEDQARSKDALAGQNCDLARKNLEALNGSPNRLARMADGSYKRLAPAERQQKIDEATKQVRENCR